MSTVSLRIPAKPEYLAFCRFVLTGLSRTTQIDPETLADMKVAVTEACSDAVRRAHVAPAGEISICYSLGERELAVEVVDGSPGGEQAAGSEQSEIDESALGMALIHAVVDELELEAGPGGRGRRLRFTKKLP